MDAKALEDRALACFVVACVELALMKNAAHRGTVVGQLALVGSKLVKEGAAAVEAVTERPVYAAKEATKEQTVNAAKEGAQVRRVEAAKPVTEKRQKDEAEVTPQMGMTWDKLEAVVKREKEDRETSVRLSQSFP